MAFKKCKFCGNTHIKFGMQEEDDSYRMVYWVKCPKCKQRTYKYYSLDSAFEAWNKQNV